MPLLDSKAQQQVREALSDLSGPIRLLMFTQAQDAALECETCSDTRQLAEEVAALSDKITLEVRDFVADADLAKGHGVDKIPAMVVLGDGSVLTLGPP